MKLLALLPLLAGVVAAADVTGIWVGQIPGRNGTMQDIAFQFSQSADTLTGKLYGDYKSTPITESKIQGEGIIFVVVAPEQAGNQINETRFRFTGRLQNGELELTRERQASTNAGNSGGVQIRPDNTKPVTFHLKRLL